MGILRTDTISGLETPTSVTGSVSFDGTGDTLTVTSSDFSFGTGDFTIECWYNLTATPTNFYIFDFGSNGMRFQIYDSGSGPVVYMTTSTSTYVIAPANSYVTVGQWYHIAMTRIGTTVTGFINGISQGTQTVADNFTHTALTIGNYGGGGDYEFTGYLSNLRILKGTALYTSNFTPPSRELQPIGDTVLLCCNNSTSVTAEATGKTITSNGNAVASTFSPGLTRDFTYGTQFDGVSRFDTQGYFVPPSGNTQNRYTLGLNEIVTSGLVLHLDAGNPFSYPATGVGTKWTDLSGNNNHGTLTNGVSYTDNNRGALVFDGTDDYVDLNTNNIITGTNPFTFEAFYKVTNASVNAELFGNYGSGYTSNTIWISGRYGVYINGAFPYFQGHPLGLGTYHMAFTRTSAGACTLYKNNVVDGTATNTTSITVGQNFRIGSDVNGIAEVFGGELYSLKVYNRALSAAEVSQNYEALKGRYGLP